MYRGGAMIIISTDQMVSDKENLRENLSHQK